MTFKQKIHQYYLQLVQDRIDAFRDMIVDLTEDSKNDAKGSAGDKHETGRAMIQLEMEKASQQLAIINEMKATLQKITVENSSKNIKLGSLIKTTKGTYFLAVSIGKITIENDDYLVVSTNSPIGKQLLGSVIGDLISFNGAKILEIA